MLRFNANSGGLIHLDSPGSLAMGDVRAEREIDIRAAGSISADSVTSVSEDVRLPRPTAATYASARSADATSNSPPGMAMPRSVRSMHAMSALSSKAGNARHRRDRGKRHHGGSQAETWRSARSTPTTSPCRPRTVTSRSATHARERGLDRCARPYRHRSSRSRPQPATGRRPHRRPGLRQRWRADRRRDRRLRRQGWPRSRT